MLKIIYVIYEMKLPAFFVFYYNTFFVIDNLNAIYIEKLFPEVIKRDANASTEYPMQTPIKSVVTSCPWSTQTSYLLFFFKDDSLETMFAK